MRNLWDLNCLYKYYDVIALCEIFELEMMHRTYRFNSSLCNSSSKLSAFIERQKSIAIIAMATNGEIVYLNKRLYVQS